MERVSRRIVLPILLAAVFCAPSAFAAGNAPVKVGVGETVITPSGNRQMVGFARSQVSTGVHDDLHARSLVVEGTDGTAVVLMSVTVAAVNEETVNLIRKGVTEKTGIPSDNIVVSATHTHSGPAIGRPAEPGTTPAYADFFIGRCVESAVKAWQTRVPGKIGVSTTEVFELGRDRRHLLYGGVAPDPEVGIIRIENAKGKLLGVAFNYGCHPSGLDYSNTLFSEDWPYFAIKGIKERIGKDIWVAFYQGAEGNVNIGYTAELSAVGVPMPVRSYWYIEKKGNQMAEAVLKALPGIKTSSANQTVRASRGSSDYPLRDTYPVSLEKAQEDAQMAQFKLAIIEKDSLLQGTRTLDKARTDVFSANQRFETAKNFYGQKDRPAARSIDQQAIRIGDAAFVTYPGELFSDIGLKIKQGSPFEKTFIIGLAGGSTGYLPSAIEFRDGDYEVDGSPWSPKTEPVCISSSLKLINQVK